MNETDRQTDIEREREGAKQRDREMEEKKGRSTANEEIRKEEEKTRRITTTTKKRKEGLEEREKQRAHEYSSASSLTVLASGLPSLLFYSWKF